MKEDGSVVSNITTDHTKPIKSTGYGYLTVSPEEATVDINKANVSVDGTLYFLQEFSEEELQQIVNGTVSQNPARYNLFIMKYYMNGQENSRWIL